MNYHNILHDDMRNGDGLRTILFVSGCQHHCKNCQNPQTWDYQNGIKFDDDAINEIYEQLSKDYIDGITFSGGDPMNENNVEDIYILIKDIRSKFPDKTIWLYTGYTFNEILEGSNKYDYDVDTKTIEDYRRAILQECTVLIDGKFVQSQADVNYKWAGSTNQQIIDVQKSLKQNCIVLWES